MVRIDYTNFKGRRSWRRIEPLTIYRGQNSWHPELQWLLDAIDLDDSKKVKSFAMSGIHEWQEYE